MGGTDRIGRGDGSARAAIAGSARRARVVLVGGAVLLVALAAASLMFGRYPIEPAQAVAMLVDRIIPLEQTWADQQATLFFNVRLPRILLAALVGCGLSAAGAAYQGTFQNPLVSSDILGASQGAALGAAVALLAGASSFTVSLTAFAFAMATVALVVLVSSRSRGDHVLTVVLVGVMVSSLAQAGVVDLLANNVAVVDSPSGLGNGNESNLEQIAAWDPDVILFGTVSGSDTFFDSVATDPTWSTLRAVQNGDYYEIPSDPYNWLNNPPTINQILGLQWLARLLYPEQFANTDSIEDVVKGYYELFYGYELSDEEFAGLTVHALPNA